MDETPFNFVFKTGKVLALTGKEDVDAQLPDDYKKSFTVIASITANGQKFPPIFLAKGTSNVCHRQFDGMESEDSAYEIYHSKGGYTDDASMIFYLKKLHEWMRNEPCVLILDQYSSHISARTKQTAASLNIRLVYIPTSATDMYQPLDKRVFGAVKSAAAKEFNDKVFATQEGFKQAEAADVFIRVWKRLSHHLIMSAWDRNDEEEEECEDESSSDTTFSDEEEEEQEEEDE